MQIVDISYPYVFISKDGAIGFERKHIKDFKSRPMKGADIKLDEVTGLYDVLNVTVDEDCVGGSCPIK